MTPDPTVSISTDYLVEFTDDAEQPQEGEPEIVVLPPLPAGTDSPPPPGALPPQGPRP
jgi:hypothetical protein